MRKALSILFVATLVVAFANADILVLQKSHTDAVTTRGQEQPARDDSTEIWIAENQMATVTKDSTTIVDLNRKVVDKVNHGNKTYVEMTIPLDMSQYLPAQVAQMTVKTKVTITPKGTTQKIDQWDCDGYDVAMDMGMMKLNMVVWATTNVPFDWARVQEEMVSNIMKVNMRLDDAALAEFTKIKGFAIKTEINVQIMGSERKASTVVTEISTKPAPEGMYSVPAGYTKQDKFTMQDLMRQ